MSNAPHVLPGAAYVELDARRYRATELTRGPWHPEHQHAGPPIALVCRAIEQVAHGHGLTHLARLTANLWRPVPIGELEVEVVTDYVGRNAAHFSAHLVAGNKEVARFTALAQRASPVVLPPNLAGHPLPTLLPQALDGQPTRMPFPTSNVNYSDLVNLRVARGHLFAGPCAIWFMLNRPLVEGSDTSGYQRVAVAADSGNGISAVLDFRKFSFVNSDLTINLIRPPVGEWICLDARTALGPDGCGLAESALYDTAGFIGRATQSIAVRAIHQEGQ